MTPDEAFAAAFEIVWEWENGGDRISVVDDPADPGGYTRGGVALNENPGLTRTVLDSMTKDNFKAWYRGRYWTPHACDQMPWPINLIVFDGEVNEGGEGAKALQLALTVKTDGDIGPVTLARLAGITDITGLAVATLANRQMHYVGLTDFSVFGRGWSRRLFWMAMKGAAGQA